MVAKCYHKSVPPRRFNPANPSFDRLEVARLAAERKAIISVGASDSCAKLGLFNEDVWKSLETLKSDDFCKTDIWHNRPDEMVDVYYIAVGDHNVYLKFSIVVDKGTQLLIVSSFKENEQI